MWNPEDYAKNSDAQLKWARELRARLDLNGDESILDVGCGDGKITADFAKSAPQSRVVGIDSSSEMISYASRTYSTIDYPNLSFACMDARSIQFNSEFDLIFSNAALHWFDDHQTFLKGASAALRSGGRLMISCGGAGNAADVLQVFSDVIARKLWKPYFDDFHNPYAFYSDQDYQPWLEAAGFRIDRLELIPKDMTHSGASGLAGWIRTAWMPFVDRVPEAQRDSFIADSVESYLDRIPLDSNQLAHVHMVRLEVEAHQA